ncbi:MAG: hypothetical protein ABIL06_14370 [Pseudomonadota bacterium]
MALIDDLPRSASMVAKEDTHILTLEWDLRKEIEQSSAMAVELLQMLSQRIRANEKFIRNTLGSFLPICANCKKIREDDDSWTPIEEYIHDHSETEFSHGICPECAKKLYPVNSIRGETSSIQPQPPHCTQYCPLNSQTGHLSEAV